MVGLVGGGVPARGWSEDFCIVRTPRCVRGAVAPGIFSMGLENLTTTTEGARPGFRWNRRWFVLEDNVLFYYSEQGMCHTHLDQQQLANRRHDCTGASECKQRISLSGATVEHVGKSASTPGYVFQVRDSRPTSEGATGAIAYVRRSTCRLKRPRVKHYA